MEVIYLHRNYNFHFFLKLFDYIKAIFGWHYFIFHHFLFYVSFCQIKIVSISFTFESDVIKYFFYYRQQNDARKSGARKKEEKLKFRNDSLFCFIKLLKKCNNNKNKSNNTFCGLRKKKKKLM
jgi:hypothetical protein